MMWWRLTNMKYTAVVAVAGLSLILALPLSHQPVKQPKHLYYRPVASKVITAKIAKQTPAKQVVTPPPVTPAVAPLPPPPPPIAPPPPASAYPTGSHEDWMAQAGISSSDFAAVDYIISHESGWNPDATEPNSGAHGLPQALPYSKTGCGWVDPICQLRWANGYAITRYGGWWAAQAYWAIHTNW